MIERTAHELTLMEPKLKEWLPVDGTPALQRMQCPNCKAAITVDWGLAVRGEYMCDGTGTRYRAHRASKRKGGEVVLASKEMAEPYLTGPALDDLVAVIATLTQELEQLQLWVYLHAQPQEE